MTRALAITSLLALALQPLSPASQAPALAPRPQETMVGTERTCTVRPGDTLLAIARRYGTDRFTLARLNGLPGQRPKAGTTLRLPTLHILPATPVKGIVLNIPERAVYVFRDRRMLGRYPVAVGRPTWQTPIGRYVLKLKVRDPYWEPPEEMMRREGTRDVEVPPGPGNPIGDRWMGWSARDVGFHNTYETGSIGRAASHGCVRLYLESGRRMFEQVSEGMPIYSVYQPIVVGRRDGCFYLSVFPDIYSKGLVSLGSAQKLLAAEGLLPLVDRARLRQMVAGRDGYPRRIVGEPVKIEVEGVPVQASLAPARVNGQWVVPVAAVARALGGEVARGDEGAVTVAWQGRTLEVAPGQVDALLDGSALPLPVVPTAPAGTLMAPLAPLLDLFGARAEANNQTLSLTRGPGAARTARR